MCWLRSKTRVLVRHPSEELVTSHGGGRGRDYPRQSQLWPPQINRVHGQGSDLSQASAKKCWGHLYGGLRVLQTPAELFREICKAVFENLLRNQGEKDIRQTN